MKSMTKKWASVVACAVLVGSIGLLGGCASQSASSASASASSSSASASSAAASSASASSASASASSTSASDSSASTQIANPWSEAASAEEAAKGAGLSAFPLPESEIGDLGKPFEIKYFYMDGMAEARFEFPASEVIARTSAAEGPEGADISGDYNTYANKWTADIAGATLSCEGNREGESTKTYWNANGLYHSLVAQGLGGDADFGLTPERLTPFVEAMK